MPLLKRRAVALAAIVVTLIVSLLAVDFAVSRVSPVNIIWPSNPLNVHSNESVSYPFSFWTWGLDGAVVQIEVRKYYEWNSSDVKGITFNIDGRSFPVDWTENGSDFLGSANIGNFGPGSHAGNLTITYNASGFYKVRAVICQAGAC